MTKTDWTKEEVRNAIWKLQIGDILLPTKLVIGMLTAYANRIEADERAVPVARVVSRSGDQEEFGERAIEYSDSIQDLPYNTPLFTQPPAQVDKCCCGEPSVSGVRHRSDGPCHLSDGDGTPCTTARGRLGNE